MPVIMIGPAMVRELGPLMTCVVLAARSGSAFAAEIGTMKVNEELDALTTMGLDPVRFLVTPRVLAAVAMTPFLAAFGTVLGIVGGALISSFVLNQPLVVYTNLLESSIGAPESRMIEQFRFESLAELEQSWGKLNDPRMADYQAEMAPLIVPVNCLRCSPRS